MRTTPIHASVLEIKSSAGAEFMPVVINVTLGLVMMIGPGLMWWPVVTYVVHKLLQWMFKRDPQLFRVLTTYVKEGDEYDPWPQAYSYNKRPLGLGRDLPLC